MSNAPGQLSSPWFLPGDWSSAPVTGQVGRGKLTPAKEPTALGLMCATRASFLSPCCGFTAALPLPSGTQNEPVWEALDLFHRGEPVICSDCDALTRSYGLAMANYVLWAAQGLWCLLTSVRPQHVAALEAQEPICLPSGILRKGRVSHDTSLCHTDLIWQQGVSSRVAFILRPHELLTSAGHVKMWAVACEPWPRRG